MTTRNAPTGAPASRALIFSLSVTPSAIFPNSGNSTRPLIDSINIITALAATKPATTAPMLRTIFGIRPPIDGPTL
jgi:hypothetical protein